MEDCAVDLDLAGRGGHRRQRFSQPSASYGTHDKDKARPANRAGRARPQKGISSSRSGSGAASPWAASSRGLASFSTLWPAPVTAILVA